MTIETVVVGPFEVNCHLVVSDDGRALVIDPGGDPDDILAALRMAEAVPAAVLLTHGHCDHVFALQEIADQGALPVFMHPADASWAFTRANLMPPWFSQIPRSPADLHPDLADGAVLDLAGLECRVIATPGHSPGSVCFHLPAHAALLTGDTLFAGSVGRTDLPGGSSRALAESILKLSAFPEETRVFPGHGPVTTIGFEKKTNYFMRGGAG